MKKVTTTESKRKIRPALSTEARESQLIDLAVSCAEQQLLDGTASSQVITHFLKLATTKERLELEKLKKENQLLEAKTEALQSSKRLEELTEKAIKVMKIYGGHGDADDDYGER